MGEASPHTFFEQFYRDGGWQSRENAFWASLRWRMIDRFSRVVPRFSHGGLVLDIGCGEAEFSRYIADASAVYGVDAAEFPLHEALKHVKAAVVGDANNLPFRDGAFDMVLLMETLYYLKNPALAFRSARRALKPDGYFVVSTGVVNRVGRWRRLLRERVTGRAAEIGNSSGGRCVTIRYTSAELRSQLAAAGFQAEEAASFFVGIPLLMHAPRLLPLMIRLGELYPEMTSFRLMVARPLPESETPGGAIPVLTRSPSDARRVAQLSVAAAAKPARTRTGDARQWLRRVLRLGDDVVSSALVVLALVALSPTALARVVRQRSLAQGPTV